MNYSSEANLCEEEDVNRSSVHCDHSSGFLNSILKKLNSVTVEPVVFLYIVGYTLIATLTTDLLLQRVSSCSLLWVGCFVFKKTQIAVYATVANTGSNTVALINCCFRAVIINAFNNVAGSTWEEERLWYC